MREIKFRLRDRRNNIVGYEKWHIGVWHPDDPDKGFDLTSGYWESSPCWLYSVDGKRWNPTPIHHRFKDQFTGLLDNQGNEVYEWDKVKQGDNYPSIIEWNHDDGMIEGTGWCLHEYYPKRGRYAYKYDRYHTTSAYTDGLEVIGDIYEKEITKEK